MNAQNPPVNSDSSSSDYPRFLYGAYLLQTRIDLKIRIEIVHSYTIHTRYHHDHGDLRTSAWMRLHDEDINIHLLNDQFINSENVGIVW